MRRCIVTGLVLVVVCSSGLAEEEGSPPDAGRLAVDPGGHTGEIRHMHFTPDGKLLLTGSFADQTVQLWDTATAQRIRVQHIIAYLRGHYTDGTFSFALSPDANLLAVGIGNPGESELPPEVRLYDFTRGTKKLLPAPRKAVERLAFSHDGSRLAGVHVFGTDHEVPVWSLGREPKLKYLRGHARTVADASFCPTNADLLATVGGGDSSVRVWNLADRSMDRVLLHGHHVFHVAWAADGKRLASVGSGVVHCWRLHEEKPFATFELKDLGPTCARTNPDSVEIGTPVFDAKGQLFVPWLAGTGGDRKSGVSALGLAGPGKGELFLRSFPSVPIVSPDGTQAAIARLTGEVRLVPLDGKVGRPLGEQPGQRAFRVAWGKDDQTIAWGKDDQIDHRGFSRFLHSLNLKTLELKSHVGEKPAPEFIPAQRRTLRWEVKSEPDQFVVLHNGNQVGHFQSRCCAVGARDGDGVLARAHTKGGLVFSTLPDLGGTSTARVYGIVRDVAVSSDGRLALTATNENMLQVYRTAWKPELLLSIYVRGEDWVAMSPAGYYAASPGAERMMGWVVPGNGVEQFIPASRLGRQIRRPDVIQRLLVVANLEEALKLAARDAPRAAKPLAKPVEKLLPPTVRLEVIDRSKLPTTVTVQATAVATVSGQPVAAIQLLLDGRPLKSVDYVKRFPTPIGPGTVARAAWTLELPPGEHRLAALAQGENTSSVSNPVDLAGPKPSSPKLGKLYQLTVGVSQYANHGKGEQNEDLNLEYAADDARLMDRVLRQSCGTLFKPAQQEVLIDAHATRDAVLNAVSALKERVEQTDLVVLHFACHGERDDEGKLWLLTHEADHRKPLGQSCLSAEKLKDVLADIPCKVLLILDVCHAGAIGRMSASNDLTSLLTDEAGAFVLAAARERERAYEGVTIKRDDKEIKLKHGLFTWMLKEALEEKAPADPFDHRVAAHNVYQYVLSQVRHWSGGKQHPYLGTPWGSKPLPLVWREP